MDDIVAQVQNVTQLIAQISHSTLEQSDGLSSLTRAVNELSNITQKTPNWLKRVRRFPRW